MSGSECPGCKTTLSQPPVAPGSGTLTVNCPRCGSYEPTDDALGVLQEELGRAPLRWAITSHAIRRMYSPGSSVPHKVTRAWLQSVWTNQKLPNPQEQADTFIEYLGTADVAHGNSVRCNPQHINGLL